MNRRQRAARWGVVGATMGASVILALGPLGLTMAGADTSLLGYNATTLAIGAQFTFNVPNLVPLPNENLIEEDAPFARTSVGEGPVVNALAAPYYPGDIAANLGSLLATFGAPPVVPNETALAESKFPASPGYPAHVTFGVTPSNATPVAPSIFSATADANVGGGDATGTLSSLALDSLGKTPSLPLLGGPSSSASLLAVGNISASNTVTLGDSSISDTSTSQVKSLGIAGLVDISGLTSTASATSDGNAAKPPTASLNLGQVTVDGESAYIDSTGVHISTTSSSTSGITPAQLQQTVNNTLSQDGVTIRVLDPKLTFSAGQAAADAGGLQIAIAHQFDVPFVPGEPTIPVPQLGNVGLPAGLYNITTSITFGVAQASVTATGLAAAILPLPTTSAVPTTVDTTPGPLSTFGSSSGSPSSFGSTTGSVQNLSATGPGSASGVIPPAVNSTATDFPLRGIPAPIGWSIAAILACLVMSYPLLLLARWQFLAPRRR